MWLPDVTSVTGPVSWEMWGRSWPLSAWTSILWVSGRSGIRNLSASEWSMKLPSAPESTSAWQSCSWVDHRSLTGRRVDVDEVFSTEISPDSSLMLTVGLALLPGSERRNVPRLHNTYKGPGISVSPSPPEKAELAPPAWVRDRGCDRPPPRRWTADSVNPGWRLGGMRRSIRERRASTLRASSTSPLKSSGRSRT